MRFFYWVTMIVLFLSLPLAARANDGTQKTDPVFQKFGIGILLNAEGDGPYLAEGAKKPMYSDADDDVPQSGTLIAESPLNEDAYYSFFYPDPNPPKATMLQKLMGNAPQPELFASVTDLEVGDGISGIVIYDVIGKYMKTSADWLWQNKTFDEQGKIFTWKEIIENKNTFPAFSPPDNRRYDRDSDVHPLGRLNEMREKVGFTPIGAVGLYTNPNATKAHLFIEEPLEFAVVDQKEEWYRVMVVLNNCRSSKGEKDFREGTLGWVKLLRENGVPNMRRTQKKCD